MTNTHDDGGPAFPVAPTMNPDGTVWYHGKDGMSLRDWFAGMALSGVMNKPGNQRSLAVDYAEYCYAIADAMLAARKEGGQ